MAVSFATGLLLTILCTVFWATKDNANPKLAKPQKVLKAVSDKKTRPMGHTLTSRSSNGVIRHEKAIDTPQTANLATGNPKEMPPGKRRVIAELPSKEGELNLNDPNQKAILPSNVSGNCNIAKNGIGDLSHCLVMNGARIVQ